MNLAFLKFDYPDLTQEEALFQVARECQAQAYYMVDGKIAGVRAPRLATRHLELILLALETARKESTGRRESEAASSAETMDTGPEPGNGGRNNHRPQRRS